MAKKLRLSVYLEPEVHRSLVEFASKHGKSKSLVAEAAIGSFLTPDDEERREAAIARRLDRVSRQMDRLERDLGISVETLALFIRFWLTTTPALPETTQTAARAKGIERYEKFLEALGRRLSTGKTVFREIPEEFVRDTSVAD
jgi:predicted transcriptional regulator